jgi:hypothetical protein
MNQWLNCVWVIVLSACAARAARLDPEWLAQHAFFPDVRQAVPSPDGRYAAVVSRGEGHSLLEVIDGIAWNHEGRYRVLSRVDPHPSLDIAAEGWSGNRLLVRSDMWLCRLTPGSRRPHPVLELGQPVVYSLDPVSGRIDAVSETAKDPIRHCAAIAGDPAESETDRDRAAAALDVLRSPNGWILDNLEWLGGHPVTVLGDPRVVDTPVGKAVQFDGVNDALLLDLHPLAGAKAFTIEVLFRPDEGGLPEQRFLHLQEEGTDDRILLETRLPGGGMWFYDTFVKSGAMNEALFAKDHLHPLGRWHRLASVCDGTTLRHYVDGTLEMEKPAAYTPARAGRMSIGVRINRVHWFKGAIRSIRFTPRALPPGEFLP